MCIRDSVCPPWAAVALVGARFCSRRSGGTLSHRQEVSVWTLLAGIAGCWPVWVESGWSCWLPPC
eukprot:287461-Prorocentrum_lima.AAC.1